MAKPREQEKQSNLVYLQFSEPIPGCLAVTAETNKVVCYAFGRIQEKYENDHFKSKTDFTYWDMNDWYKEMFGFSYHSMWSGFNLPVKEAMLPFIQGEISLGAHHEQQLIEAVKRYQPKYVIGYAIDDYDCYRHELKHAMFYLSETYRKSVTKLLEKYRLKFPDNYEELENYLRGMKYSDTVLVDEMHAYISERPWSTKFKLGNNEMHRYRKAFQRGIAQLNLVIAEEKMDVTGNRRLRQRVNKVAVEGIRNKYNQGLDHPSNKKEDNDE